MSGHTPGPWQVMHGIVTVPHGLFITRDIQSPVARMDGSTHAAFEQEANAVLIAAAPTMLSAIEQFEAWWQEVGQVSFNGAPACVFALREAAAKARGGV